MTPSMIPVDAELGTDDGHSQSDIVRRMTWYETDASSGQELLEIAAGNGHWSHELAVYMKEDFTDITKPNDADPYSPIPIPEESFETHSLLSLPPDWSEKFIMTHIRLLACAGMSADQRRQAVKELYRITKPGGVIQLIELDHRFRHPNLDEEFPAMAKLVTQWMKTIMEKDGLAWDSADQLYKEVEQAGFKHHGIRGSSFGGDASDAPTEEAARAEHEKVKDRMVKEGIKSEAEVDELIEDSVKEWKEMGSKRLVFDSYSVLFGRMKERIVKEGLASEEEFDKVLGGAAKEAEKAIVKMGFDVYILTATKGQE